MNNIEILKDENGRTYIICENCGHRIYGAYNLIKDLIVCYLCRRELNDEKNQTAKKKYNA